MLLLFTRSHFLKEKTMMSHHSKRLLSSVNHSYFTGNPNYYQHLLTLNQLLRERSLKASAITTKVNWMSLAEMQTNLDMKLSKYMYSDLINKLNTLYELKDPQYNTTLEVFIPKGKTLESPPRKSNALDKEGRAVAVASRKTAKATVWMVPGNGLVYVNGHSLSDYFSELKHRQAIIKPFTVTDKLCKYNVWAIAENGGNTGKAEAVAVAVARALSVFENDPALRIPN
jgi:small subunit ribosomal protein S9